MSATTGATPAPPWPDDPGAFWTNEQVREAAATLRALGGALAGLAATGRPLPRLRHAPSIGAVVDAALGVRLPGDPPCPA